MITESDGKPLEKTMSRKITRRGALKLIAGAGTALATGRHINTVQAISTTEHKTSTKSQDAKALIDESSDFDIEPTPRPETRDPYVQMIDTTTLSFDPDLPKETDRKLVIVGVSENPFANEFTDLNPNNVYDRLDRLYIELCRSLQPRRKEIKDLDDKDFDFDDSPMNLRALNNGEVPPQLPIDEYNEKLIRHKESIDNGDDSNLMRIWMWAYDKDSTGPEDVKLTYLDPTKGMEVRILKDPPKVGFNKNNDGSIVAGYTHEVVDGRLVLGIYRKDFDVKTGGADPAIAIYTPSFNLDWVYSTILRASIEDLILFGGNTQMHNGIDVKYLQARKDLPSASLFPEVAELAGGALRAYDAFDHSAYDSAPVLHIMSPSVDAANRYRQ